MSNTAQLSRKDVEMRLDMNRICEEIEAKGVSAYVEMTGGGVATIYAGNDHAVCILAGPGAFAGDAYTLPEADSEGFAVSREDGSEGEVVSPDADETAIATLILAYVQRAVSA